VSAEEPNETYQLLRHLTLPVVAITTSARGRRNGLIVNSAQRASLVPSLARISLYISKPNFSHDLIHDAGVFGVHLLRTDQYDVIRALGLRSARDVPDKLEGMATRAGVTGCPLLSDVIAAFECRVVNAMDAGAATFFLGEVVGVTRGTAGDVMTSAHFRANAPADLLREYEERLKYAQGILEPLSADIDTARGWPGPSAAP
jgi:flavin reductase (DIM6/NTAB) family NADH-FMN oxidoreductase RutF